MLAVNTVDYKTLILLAIGGYCMVGASNTFNQIIKKEPDALMKRTKDRPLPAGRMTVTTAMTIAIVLTVHQEMVDDVKVVMAEYRLALNKNKREI